MNGKSIQMLMKNQKKISKNTSQSQGKKKTQNSKQSDLKILKKARSSVESPVTSTKRSTRKRKTIERYSSLWTSASRAARKPFTHEKGKGTRLKDIPNVAYKLAQSKYDDNVQILHTILFGKRTKVHASKNIGLFSGYVWGENEEKHRSKVKERIDKCVKKKLLELCDILDIPISNKSSTKKGDISAKILNFLEFPHATIESSIADKTVAKNRWAGKTIVDLFTDEFKGRPRDYYVSAVESGRIQVEGETVPASYIVQSSQKISHFLHRHEPPVMALDVLILQNEPDVLTVYKPASVPVHPCGQYRKNTVVGILQAEHDLAPLFPIHRLDRLVSGLLILARSASKADFFRQQIESGLVEKKYIAKVIGVFPKDEKIVNANVNFNAREGRSTAEVSEDCGNGITALKGKVACTKFNRISTDGKHSIVSCQPITGRTHQIRVHLQYIGHPIANDTLYLSESVDIVSTEGIRTNREFKHFSKSDSELGSGDASEKGSEKDFTIDPLCTNCPNLAPKGYDGYEEGLWLHCVQYSGPGWAYECPLPDWAILS